MIIWRGMGVLALVIAVALNVLVNESANNLFGIPDGFKHYRDENKYMWFVGMSLSAIACWYLGRWLDARETRNAKVVIDKETGQEIRLVSRHDLFWIPVKWWAVVWLVAGLWLMLN